MALPAAPTEAGGAKLHYLVDDNAGTNRANAFLGVGSTTINTERVAWLGVASHVGNSTIAATDPTVLMAGRDSTTARHLLVDSGGRLVVASDVANDAVDSGNPIKIGGRAQSTTPTAVAAGDRVNAWYNLNGAAVIASGSAATGADGATNTAILPLGSNSSVAQLGVFNWLFNGTSWDRIRGDVTNGMDVDVTRMPKAATATLSNVAGSATSVTLLALNAARLGASIHKDSSAILYVKFGTTASTTSFTVKMAADAHYEVPFGYTGRIDGIWASATGDARVTELT